MQDPRLLPPWHGPHTGLPRPGSLCQDCAWSMRGACKGRPLGVGLTKWGWFRLALAPAWGSSVPPTQVGLSPVPAAFSCLLPSEPVSQFVYLSALPRGQVVEPYPDGLRDVDGSPIWLYSKPLGSSGL